MGLAALLDGDLAHAKEHLTDSLARYHALKDGHGMAFTLFVLSAVAQRRGEPERCIRLLGAEETLRRATASSRPQRTQETLDSMLAELREAHGEAVVSAWYTEGQLLTRDQAVAYSLSREAEASAAP